MIRTGKCDLFPKPRGCGKGIGILFGRELYLDNAQSVKGSLKQIQFGAQSKECLHYMAKVSDEVYRSKRLKKTILMGALAVLACILLVTIIWHVIAG